MIWKNTGVFYRVKKQIDYYEYDNQQTFYEGNIYRVKKMKDEMVIVSDDNPDNAITSFTKTQFNKHFEVLKKDKFKKCMPVNVMTEKNDAVEISLLLFGFIGLISLFGFGIGGYYQGTGWFNNVLFYLVWGVATFTLTEVLFFRRMQMFKKRMKTYFVSYTYEDALFTKIVCFLVSVLATMLSVGIATTLFELIKLIHEHIFAIIISIGIVGLFALIVWSYTYINYLFTK